MPSVGSRRLAPPESTARTRLFFVAGLVWGLCTALAFLWIPLQIVGIAAALMLVALGPNRLLLRWSESLTGAMMWAYALVVVASGMLNGSEVAMIVRYLVVVAGFLLILEAARQARVSALWLGNGLLCGGFVLVAWHVLEMDWARLFDPMYRISLFLNPNGVGFIAAMTGIGLLAHLLTPPAPEEVEHGGSPSSPAWRALLAVAFAMTLVVCFATKSRTALVAFVTGLGVVFMLARPGDLWKVLFAGAVGLVAALGVGFGAGLLSEINEVYMLSGSGRDITTGTGRFVVWEFILSELWPAHPWLGVGPGQHDAIILARFNQGSSHNGYLMNLAELGLVGLLPLVIVMAYAALRTLKLLRHRAAGYLADLSVGVVMAAGWFAAGAVEALGETLFFSVGNPGSLMFLCGIAILDALD